MENMDNKKEPTSKGTKIVYMSGAARAPIPMLEQLETMVIGQSNALSLIIPFIQTYNAGLNPANRPAANILLCGNTGLGKTSTVESLATLLHGSPKNMIRVDCGEFQMDHEVAKLIGAPPGYLGHRETQPVFTQNRLNSVKSDNSKLSLILFDEIEKASRGLMQILLGVMDKAQLRLGDSTTVDFTDTMIFLSSNLGAKQVNDALRDKIGFSDGKNPLSNKQIKAIVERAAKKHFSSEFMNRLDEIAYYYPLTDEDLRKIVNRELELLQDHYNNRLGTRTFMLGVGQEMFDHILKTGTSPEFGARELKRKIYRYITQDIVQLLNSNDIPTGSVVLMNRGKNDETEVRILTDYSELPDNYWFFDRVFNSAPPVARDEDGPDDEAPKRRKKKS